MTSPKDGATEGSTSPDERAREIALECGTSFQPHIDFIAAHLRAADGEGFKKGFDEGKKTGFRRGYEEGSEWQMKMRIRDAQERGQEGENV